ncbi:MAG: hypothetical protein WDA20_12455 [Desulfuromonadales bacterium]
MKCPICGGKTRVEIDTHSDGFADNLQECGDCGTVWTRKEGEEIILHTLRAASNY